MSAHSVLATSPGVPLVALIGYDEPFVMPDWVPAYFADQGIDFTVSNCRTPEETLESASGAAVILTSSGRTLLTASVMRQLSRCHAIVRIGSGVDCIDLVGATACNIPVINTPDALASAVAEHTVALLHAAVHQIPANDRLVKSGRWQERSLAVAQRVRNKTLGLIGFGRIARQVAALLVGYQMTVLVYDPPLCPTTINEAGAQPVSFEELLEQADFVSIHAPLTASTHHLIGQAALRLMKPTAILVNTARGGLVDQEALTLALREQWIAGAALDVMDPEPPMQDEPLLQLPNLVLTPHTAAFTEEVRDGMYLAGCKAAISILNGDLSALSVVNGVVLPW